METRAHHVLIGLFTVLVVGAALMFALWLGKSDADRQFEIYDIVFQEAVSGLSKGGTVEFNGIKIGDVVSLRLDPDDARRVIARVRVDAAAPVRTDTEARLVPAGITGLTMIRLTSGDDPGSVPLQAEDDVVPRLVAVPSAFGRLLADGEDAVTNVNELLVQARMLFSAENVAAIGRTLDNLEQTTAALAAQRDDVNAVLKQVTQASVEASTALAEATRVLGTANRLVEQQGTQTLDSAREAMLAFERAMGSVEALIADNRAPLDGGLRGLAEIGPAVAELRTTLASLRAITRQLEDRPADYLLGLEPTKEFTP
ncbi:MlaD family protein [Thauera sp. ZXT1-4]|jgi:phospholipid/cholesterol/gamma-HCH transport system substrate-binding protein|uniref:MlaD family protein n=1 Tax=Thauera sp. ZXT1-4 TaxID=3460294 RepID=UPI0040409E00